MILYNYKAVIYIYTKDLEGGSPTFYSTVYVTEVMTFAMYHLSNSHIIIIYTCTCTPLATICKSVTDASIILYYRE